MNNKGFAVKELIILFSVLAVLFALAITKVSFAFEEVDQEEQLADLKNSNLLAAANVYVMMHKDLFTEAETYFYYNGDPITYESDVIDKEIVQVLVSGYGSACKVLFLMEDGTVRYIEGNDIIKRDFTLRNIDNLKDVVRLQKATFTRNNGGATILAVAVMSDGTSKVIE